MIDRLFKSLRGSTSSQLVPASRTPAVDALHSMMNAVSHRHVGVMDGRYETHRINPYFMLVTV